MASEFYSFDETLRELNIDENRLRRLVSEGEIRGFREGGAMKFKRVEIDALTGRTSRSSPTEMTEIDFDDDAPIDFGDEPRNTISFGDGLDEDFAQARRDMAKVSALLDPMLEMVRGIFHKMAEDRELLACFATFYHNFTEELQHVGFNREEAVLIASNWRQGGASS